MRRLFFTALALILFGCRVGIVQADSQGKPFVESKSPFIAIKDVNRQADNWAMCSATYTILSRIMRGEKPARAKQLKQLANGAGVAVTMAVVLDGMEKDISKERFSALWNTAKLMGSELPQTKLVGLQAELESATGDRATVFSKDLNATFKVCLNNLKGQQFYIESWRELAKSGLLTFPNNSSK